MRRSAFLSVTTLLSCFYIEKITAAPSSSSVTSIVAPVSKSMRGQVLGLYWTQKDVLNANGEVKEYKKDIPLGMKEMLVAYKREFMNEEGSAVNYKAISSSPLFEEYKSFARSLSTLNLPQLTQAEKMSFFINTYNMLTIHGLVEGKLVENKIARFIIGPISARLRFYASMSYNIGGYIFSLNDIEGGVLRGNKKAAAPLSVMPFDSKDARLAFVLPCDARIHFALNCGAKSCPPIRAYSPEAAALEKELDEATTTFISRTSTVDLANKKVTLSMLFKWYQDDFGSGEFAVLDWIRSHASGTEVGKQMSSLLDQNPGGEGVTVEYATYDWGLNDLVL